MKTHDRNEQMIDLRDGTFGTVDTTKKSPLQRSVIHPIDGGFDSVEEVDDVPFKVSKIDDTLIGETLLAVCSGLALALSLRGLMNWGGLMSAGVWWFIASMAISWALFRDRLGPVVAVDRIVTVIIWSVGAMACSLLAWLVIFIFIRGLPELRPGFFTTDLSTATVVDIPGQEGGSKGGALHAIVGTIEQVGIATLLSVPIAMLTAVYLHEIKGRMAPVIRFVVNALSGLPSIVAGLLIFVLWVNRGAASGNAVGPSGLAASVALAILMLPTVTRTAEEILRTIPDSLREASLALGSPHWRTVATMVVPTARAGLLTAIILGIARAIGETAPVLLTAFGSTATNYNPLDGPQGSLPVMVWSLIRQPNTRQVDRAWTGALVLLIVVILLFVSTRLLSARADRRLGGRR
jgi:phosphate transport system permease protein